MKPYKTLLFLVGFLFICWFIIHFSPFRKWELSSSLELKLPNTFFYSAKKSSEKKAKEQEEKKEILPLAPIPVKPQIREYPQLQNITASPFYKDSNYPHPLSAFYESLSRQKTDSECLRVLHFGDSQIESDHISKTLRECLQYSFGGKGKGFINIFNSQGDGQYQVKLSKEWKKMEMRNAQRKGNFGPYNAYLYLPAFANTNSYGHIQIKPYKKIETNDSTPLLLSILCHEDISPDEIELSTDKIPARIIGSKLLFGLRKIDYQIPAKYKEIQAKVIFGKNHFIYAISINTSKGIYVDNIPLRGNSGRIFLQNNRQFLETSYKLLNVDLLIFQFGINAVPQNPKQVLENFDYYEKTLYLELSYLRSIMPELPILLVGTSDRSRRENGLIETNPNILLIREAQKKAALKSGCAYWDLFEAMGGNNSMQKWVEANPALANKDYTHFNLAGSEKVGKLLYKSLIADYTEYFIKKQEVKNE